jgi:hypothetical protein
LTTSINGQPKTNNGAKAKDLGRHGKNCAGQTVTTVLISHCKQLMRLCAIVSLCLVAPPLAVSFWPAVVGGKELNTDVEVGERTNEVLKFLLNYEQQKFESDQVI